MKVGKEDAMGMLMAVEMWMTRDHDAEWAQWASWLETIADRISKIDGVETSVVQPIGLSNRTPTLSVRWGQRRFGLTGREVAEGLFDGDPRIAMHTQAEKDGQTGIAINPYMMSPGEDRIVADQLHALLARPSRRDATPPKPPVMDLTGEWEVEIQYAVGRSTHSLFLRQKDHALDGSHRGDFVERGLQGRIDGADVEIRSRHTEDKDGNALFYTFTGTAAGDTMSGELDMGEYLGARWTARRRIHA
jgi:L-seryl-tRNA(Ser) seleniumtransferase